MPDTFSRQERSEIMRSVKSRGNKSTELRLIALFRANRLTGWRRNYNLTGRPDFVFPQKKVVVFADGCFWHGHNCRNVKPVDHAEYWHKKITKNRKRDRQVTRTLSNEGWSVVRLWECEIKREEIKKLLRVFLS